jgi:hypothetical protein
LLHLTFNLTGWLRRSELRTRLFNRRRLRHGPGLSNCTRLLKTLGFGELPPLLLLRARLLDGTRLLFERPHRGRNRRSLRCWSRLLRLPPTLLCVLHPVLVIPHLGRGRTIVAKILASADVLRLIAAAPLFIPAPLEAVIRRRRRRTVVGFSARLLRRRNGCGMQRTLTILQARLRWPHCTEPLAILDRPYGRRGNHSHARIHSSGLRLQRSDLRTTQRSAAIGTDGCLLAVERHGSRRRRRTRNHRPIHEGRRRPAHIHLRAATQHAFP